jgi:hypothetical protein
MDLLAAKEPIPDLVNQVLEATIETADAGVIILRRYDLPIIPDILERAGLRRP